MSSKNTTESAVASSEATVKTIDWNSSDPAAITIVETVAAVREADPTELEPLSSTVDPDALNTLFAASGGGAETGVIQFEYENCLISVTADGAVSVAPVEQ